MDQRGFYVKICPKTQKIFLFVNFEQFKEYIAINGSQQWNKFVIYENDDKSGKYSHNIKLITNKDEAND